MLVAGQFRISRRLIVNRKWTLSVCAWILEHTGPKEGRLNGGGIGDLANHFRIGVELPDFDDVQGLRARGVATPLHLPTTGFKQGLCNPTRVVEELVLPAYRKCMSEVAAPGEAIIAFTGIEPAPNDSHYPQLVRYLRRLAEDAEEHRVRVVVEMLNPYGTHADCMEGHTGYVGCDFDKVATAVAEVNSPWIQTLFDVYHVVRVHGEMEMRKLLRKHFARIGHVHVAGPVHVGKGVGDRVPVYDVDQLVYWPKFLRLLTELGYDKVVGIENIIPDDEDHWDCIQRTLDVLLRG